MGELIQSTPSASPNEPAFLSLQYGSAKPTRGRAFAPKSVLGLGQLAGQSHRARSILGIAVGADLVREFLGDRSAAHHTGHLPIIAGRVIMVYSVE